MPLGEVIDDWEMARGAARRIDQQFALTDLQFR
jgi:hypothetical protein